MNIQNLSQMSKNDLQTIIDRNKSTRTADVFEKTKAIIENIQQNGDKALQEYANKYGSMRIQEAKVTQAEIDVAYREVNEEVIKALRQAAKNIKAVHEAQLKIKVEPVVQPELGISVWREWRAIERVGLYVPGGKSLYPSSVLMTCIPAVIAGCPEIVITTPPDSTGKVNPALLIAADMSGIKTIYKIGGAQAIAALAYGTETIPKVDKIFGPGNQYVTAAKILVSQDVAIDMPAGPSEVLVIADETANPAFIAADLLADGEHGDDSACVLVTTSQSIATQTAQEIEKQLAVLPTAERVRNSLAANGLMAVTNTLDEAIQFSNEYAPEHLHIMTKDNQEVIKKITSAGSVFVGDWTSKSSGDYATGANHVLPTSQTARMFPPLGVDAFGKWMQVQECTKEGLANIREAVELLSDIEGLPAHKRSTAIRFE